MLPILLLVVSNIFMTFAWYGHLRYGEKWPLFGVILASWGMAFFEYCFQVPANRMGYHQGYSPAALKIIQEAITLIVFAVFARTFLHEAIRWNHYVAFGLVLAAVFVVNCKW